MTDEISADAYAQNSLTSLRSEILEIVEKQLTPISQKFLYAAEPLEQKIKWQPCVLVVGNYSSGKSTFINELLGNETQRTGQAPTDDSFTVIVHDDKVSDTETKDGKTILSSDSFPFAGLKKFGRRLSSHFTFKKVNNPAIAGFAIIDTPGMLDSVSERDRGYDYQEVLAELAEICDLILVMFDPHKAGTIRETYESLRQTLPRATYEDRVLFVLNRVDECQNITDLIRVYGTLCWNLSQMTGRKDIPLIRMTWSPAAVNPPKFLEHLDNQRQELRGLIQKAPKYRLDHMVTFLDEHTLRLGCMLRALRSFQLERRRGLLKAGLIAVLVGAVLGVGAGFGLLQLGWSYDLNLLYFASGVGSLALMLLSYWLLQQVVVRVSLRRAVKNIDALFGPRNELERESWQKVKGSVQTFIAAHKGRYRFKRLSRDIQVVTKLHNERVPEFRRALEEM